MLGQHHVTSPATALEELRVNSHARRGIHPTGSRADFGSTLDTRAPMDLDQRLTSRQLFNNLRSGHSPRPQYRCPPRQVNAFSPSSSRPNYAPRNLFPRLLRSPEPRPNFRRPPIPLPAHLLKQLQQRQQQQFAPLLHPPQFTFSLDPRVPIPTTQSFVFL